MYLVDESYSVEEDINLLAEANVFIRHEQYYPAAELLSGYLLPNPHIAS
jgi:hypothetical protein